MRLKSHTYTSKFALTPDASIYGTSNNFTTAFLFTPYSFVPFVSHVNHLFRFISPGSRFHVRRRCSKMSMLRKDDYVSYGFNVYFT